MGTNGFDKRPQDINRKGRPPKAWTMSSLIEEALEEELEKGTPVKKQIAKKLAQMAVRGDIQAIKEINDRIDGRPKQFIDHTTNGKDLPTPLLHSLDVPNNNSTSETQEPE